MIKSAEHAAAVSRLRVSEPQLAVHIPFYRVWVFPYAAPTTLAYFVLQVALTRLKDVYS